MSLWKTSDIWGGAIFDPRAIIWKILVEVHKIKLHTKYQMPGPSSSDKKNFKSIAYRSLFETFDISIKRWRLTECYNIFKLYCAHGPQYCIPSKRAISLLVPEKKILKIFYHIWLWRTPWSCDPNVANFRSPGPWRFHMKFDFIWPSGFWEEDVWRVWTMVGWRSLLIVLIIILTMWPRCGE